MKLKLFIKQYKYELITLIADILLAAFIFLNVSSSQSFILYLLVFIISTFIIVYLRTKDKNFYFYPFDDFGQDQDWVGNGKFSFVRNENCYEITDSDAGLILPKTLLWDDYVYKMDFKIVRVSLAFIVRAMNLSNSVMIQIFENRIKPHLRINGEWIWLDEFKIEKKISLDKWYKLTVTCEKRKIVIKIVEKETEEIICDKVQIIPSNIKVNRPLDVEGKKIESFFIQNLDFDFGAIGLRNFPGEVAFIRNMYIERM